MRYSKLTASVFLSLGITPLAGATDLLDIYHAAQSQDAVFAAARASQQAGEEKLTQGRSLLLPSVSLNANTTKNNVTTTYAPGSFLAPYGGNQQYNSHGYGATLVQPLFREQNWALYNESELQVAISEAQFKLAEQDLILRSAQAYFDVLIAQDNVQLTAAQKTAISEQLEQAKRNFEVGTATVTDTYEAQARYDLIVAQELNAANNLEIKRRSLQQLVNGNVGTLNDLGPGFKLEAPVPADIQKWVDDARHGNYQIAMAQAAAEIADREVDRNRGGHLPTVDLVANYNKNTTGGGTFGATDTRSTAIGVQLNMPLFQGGAIQSKWREAEANREKARQDLENARRNVELQTRQAYLGVVSGISQVQALQQALKSSESLLEASKLGQQVGVRTNLDVLNAQQQLFSTRRDLYQAQYNYLVSQLSLKAAVGGLVEDDLGRVNLALH
ncbi:type I secretion outer membrane protein, TolC family [Sideroxydans lithotrophicus ES-1]|uniref:Type I secretion outer membrane protein, TolC family n=2 Tax=Sideroxydans TaxID=314343 RepID=D5CQ09_SIDLE|nr:type I secretion outer membrane protein, TolC family [Sideroxydans lithotrophicus ES-1]